MQPNPIIPHSGKSAFPNMQGLLILLEYARSHRHSRLWVGAIQMILARTEG
jgi:hypothetical protein